MGTDTLKSAKSRRTVPLPWLAARMADYLATPRRRDARPRPYGRTGHLAAHDVEAVGR